MCCLQMNFSSGRDGTPLDGSLTYIQTTGAFARKAICSAYRNAHRECSEKSTGQRMERNPFHGRAFFGAPTRLSVGVQPDALVGVREGGASAVRPATAARPPPASGAGRVPTSRL